MPVHNNVNINVLTNNEALELESLESLDFETLSYTLFEELINIPVVYTSNNNNNNNHFYLDLDIDINNEIERIINSSLNDNSVYKQVIADDELNKLIKNKQKYSNIISNKPVNNICPIMQIEFEDQQDIIKLECNHCFDADAIIYWLKEEKAECPVCRFKFKSKEIKIENHENNNNNINNNNNNNNNNNDLIDLQRTRESLINSLSRLSMYNI